MSHPKSVFISYVTNDREYVTKFSQTLKSYNVVSLQINLEIATGGNPYDRTNLQHALKSVKHAIIVISKSYFDSQWHTAEFNVLMGSEMNAKNNFVIPIIIDDCVLPKYVERNNCIDFNHSFDGGINILADRLTGKRKHL